MRIAFCCVFHERTVTDKLYSELFVYTFGAICNAINLYCL